MVAYTFYEVDARVRRYAETLVKRGDEVEAITVGRKGQPKREWINGVLVHRIQTRTIDETSPRTYLVKLLAFLFRSTWVLARRNLAARYDLIHVHSVPDFEVFAALIPRLLGARVILDIHDIIPELYASKFKVSERSFVFRVMLAIEKLSAAFAHHVIIANHLWHTKLTERSVPRTKCTPLINYPDLSIFFRRPQTAKKHDEFLLCYPGTLNWHQGVELVIQAIAIIRDRAPHVKFLIIGDGPERNKLKAMISSLGLENCVTLSERVPVEKIAEIMANVDLGVVPKRKDSFGNEAFSTKIMEFMAMGVPVLASRTRIDEYYFDDEIVQFFESENVDDLAAAILDLATNPARRVALRERASEFIAANSWDVKKQEYLDLVDRLVYGAVTSVVPQVKSESPETPL